MNELRIADEFALPLEVVTEAIGIVATRGAGKSYTSAVLLEEAHTAEVPFVVLDPSGVYHGLRSSANGEKAGLPVYVLGGPHGDVPLEDSAGRFTADLVVDSGHSFVLDLSDFTKTKMRRFVAEFLERLYDRKARSRTTLLLVVDEADEFAPQKPRGDTINSLAAMETIAKRGRARGLGVVMITQRTQALNKDVLDLIETLIAMRQLAKRSRDSVEGWIADKDLRDEAGVIESLQSLPTGTAWVWSPLRGILERIEIRRIRTFDSYATPKPGETRVEPTKRAELDLDALGEQMRATVERAKANDPAQLRRKVRDLERELARRPAEQEVVERTVEVPIEIPVVSDEQIELLQSIAAELRDVGDAVSALRAVADQIETAAKTVRANPKSEPMRERASRTPSRPPSARPQPVSVEAGELSAYALGLLQTLAERYPMRLTRSQISTFSGRKPRSSAFSGAIAEITRGGYVVVAQGQYELTEAGIDAVGDVASEPATASEVLEMWRRALPDYERDLFDALVDAGDEGLTRPELAERTGRSLTSSAFSAAISTLAKNGLAESSGGVVRARQTLLEAVA